MTKHKPRGLSLADAFAWFEKIPQPAPFEDLTEPCLIWQAAKTDGYGAFWWGGKTMMAYRVAYELANGPQPPGTDIDHRCLVRACVEATHLRATSHKVNAENRGGANRNSKTGVRGVSLQRDGKYQAYVGHRGQVIRVGTFAELEEADRAVRAKRAELYGPDFVER